MQEGAVRNMVALPFFWTISGTKSSLSPSITKIYERVLPYITAFLCAQHPNRKGAMCPFVPAALKEDRVYFTFFNVSNNYGRSFISECIKFFLNKKDGKSFNALIILFPENFRIDELLKIHWDNKKQCIDNSLMIGAMWDKNQAQSLHNDKFFPLRTPTPILVIRDLTVSDLIFMNPKHYNTKVRLSFLKSFIKTFDKKNSSQLALDQVNKAKELKKLYELKQIKVYTAIVAFIIFGLALLYKVTM